MTPHVHDFELEHSGHFAREPGMPQSSTLPGAWRVSKCSCETWKFEPDPEAWAGMAVPEAYIITAAGQRIALEPEPQDPPTRELWAREHRYGQKWVPVAAFNEKSDAELNDVRGLYRDLLAPDEVRVVRYIPELAVLRLLGLIPGAEPPRLRENPLAALIERDAVVAWLRGHAKHHELARHDEVARELEEKARQIEDGRHRK
jgi:hypothetical protein